jgi:hypothetical protein
MSSASNMDAVDLGALGGYLSRYEPWFAEKTSWSVSCLCENFVIGDGAKMTSRTSRLGHRIIDFQSALEFFT